MTEQAILQAEMPYSTVAHFITNVVIVQESLRHSRLPQKACGWDLIRQKHVSYCYAVQVVRYLVGVQLGEAISQVLMAFATAEAEGFIQWSSQ